MGDAWFREVADELARCLADAKSCAVECEGLLEGELPRRAHDAVLVAVGVARAFIDPIDEPRHLLATALLFRSAALQAIATLDEVDASAAVTSLRTAAASCQRLLDATA